MSGIALHGSYIMPNARSRRAAGLHVGPRRLRRGGTLEARMERMFEQHTCADHMRCLVVHRSGISTFERTYVTCVQALLPVVVRSNNVRSKLKCISAICMQIIMSLCLNIYLCNYVHMHIICLYNYVYTYMYTYTYTFDVDVVVHFNVDARFRDSDATTITLISTHI